MLFGNVLRIEGVHGGYAFLQDGWPTNGPLEDARRELP